MSGRIDFTMGFNTQRSVAKNSAENGYRIYILGNFSGQSDLSCEQRKIRAVDLDNFDQVMAQAQPLLKIDSSETLRFQSLDDFHPDALIVKVKEIADLLELKKELSDPNKAMQAAEKIQTHYKTETKPDISINEVEVTESSSDMLERLLGKTPDKIVEQQDSVGQLISQIMAPYIQKDADPQYQTLIEAIDSTTSQYLQTLLHRQDFQQLEALWRSTEMLVNEELGDEQNVFLIDISQAELLSELRVSDSVFVQKVLDHIQSGEQEQEVLLVADACFSDSEENRELLMLCSQLAKNCNGLFLAGADKVLIKNSIFSGSENTQQWSHYLNEINSDRMMLAYPRYMLRLPYGNKRDPIEAFKFEECSAIPRESELLWGNSAFLCARVFIRTSQGQQSEEHFYFNDIYSFAIDQDGQEVLQPATEELLNETQVNTLLSKGITPLVSFRQRQGVRVVSLLTC